MKSQSNFVQGWFKFGGVELGKIKTVEAIGEKFAWENKTAIYLGSAALAETVADIFLCPLEAVRIRSGLLRRFGRWLSKFAVQGEAADVLNIYIYINQKARKKIPSKHEKHSWKKFFFQKKNTMRAKKKTHHTIMDHLSLYR